MRTVVYRIPDLVEAERTFAPFGEPELPLPPGEPGEDGEWLLAVVEVGPHHRAMSAAGRVLLVPDGVRLVFEPRDWSRLAEFCRDAGRQPSSPPGDDGEEPAPKTAPSQAPTPRPAPSRVLVVDDDADIREMVAVMLEAVGLVVTPAASAEDALVLVGGARFDLVVLDWNLPKMNGLELCRTLRKEARFSGMPVLFLTANASSQDMIDAFASGGDDYVVKPFRAPELGARIFALLRRARR